jgi:hypothetical protein
MKTCMVAAKDALWRPHISTKLARGPFIQAAQPQHTEDPEPRQLLSGIVIGPLSGVLLLLMAHNATLADSETEMAL